MSGIWVHIFTPFDTWWPNIEAAVVWGTPAAVLAIVHAARTRRLHRDVQDKLDPTTEGGIKTVLDAIRDVKRDG